MLLSNILSTSIGLLFAVGIAAQQDQNYRVDYNVISLLNQTTFKSMAVVIDNISYPLEVNKTFPILYSGKGPSAQTGYHYAKVYNNDSLLLEPFVRQPVNQSTPHEFFNRSWNTHESKQLPQVYPPLDAIHRIHSDLHRDNEIPTIHITGNQTLIDQMNRNTSADISVPSNISYLSLRDAFYFEDVEISLSGRSSRWMPKLSYNLKLKKKDDLYGYRRLKLRALYTDPSYIREKLAYDIIKSVGLVSSEFSYVRVLMNDQELGLFGIIDTFKNPWLANVFANGSSSYKNGYLYQGVFATPESSAQNHTSDLSYINNITAYGDGQYKIKEEASKGKKEDWEPLMKFTEFVAKAPTNSSDAVHKWNKELDTDSFLRSMALEVLLGYSDGYLTMADNYYLYQNPDTDNFFYISSDMDLTIGSTMFKLDKMWSGNYSNFPQIYSRPVMKQILQVPEFKERYNQLLQNITSELINPNVTAPFIDNIVDMIKEDVAWDQSLPRTGNNLFAGSFDNAQNNSEVTDAIGQIPPGFDMDTLMDFAKRMNETIPFETAVTGPTGHTSLTGIKEWFNAVYQNTTRFYSQ
ncbi:coth-domain-containing protein [Rhizopus microsporus var. microsporus]|uniref:Coth-domain-containing protein n=1 Tax=Rhizopus microsporus var. microsporus TaxID=86635 RepID=A0A1X0QR49_RHIZD|nr:coth-domain-containing protein [Rhizopus microsporus var. microsporus]